MRKLLTPVQYEPSLEGLNAIRPLQLADEGKIAISYPVLCHNPPTEGRPAFGKLARCTPTGSLVSYKSNDISDYEYIQKVFVFGTTQIVITFAQKVSLVLCIVESALSVTETWWSDPTYTRHFKAIHLIDPTFLNFSGVDLYVIGAFFPSFGNLTIGFYGFY